MPAFRDKQVRGEARGEPRVGARAGLTGRSAARPRVSEQQFLRPTQKAGSRVACMDGRSLGEHLNAGDDGLVGGLLRRRPAADVPVGLSGGEGGALTGRTADCVSRL